MITGKQLHDARMLRGHSREQAADLLGVHAKTVSNWERSEVPERQEAIVRARYFATDLHGVSDVELMAEVLLRLGRTQPIWPNQQPGPGTGWTPLGGRPGGVVAVDDDAAEEVRRGA